MNRSEVLETAHDLITGDRAKDYGSFGDQMIALSRAFNLLHHGDPDAPETRALLREVGRRYLPRLVLAVAPAEDDELPLLRGRRPEGGQATAWVCRDYACLKPTVDPAELGRLLDEAR